MGACDIKGAPITFTFVCLGKYWILDAWNGCLLIMKRTALINKIVITRNLHCRSRHCREALRDIHLVSLRLKYVWRVVVARLCILKQRLSHMLWIRKCHRVVVRERLSLILWIRMSKELLMKLMTRLWVMAHAACKASVAWNRSIYASGEVRDTRAIHMKRLLEVWCIHELLYFSSRIREVCLCLEIPTYNSIRYKLSY